MATWIVGGALALVVGFIIRKMIADRKKGRGCCGGDCARCHAACSSQPK